VLLYGELVHPPDHGVIVTHRRWVLEQKGTYCRISFHTFTFVSADYWIWHVVELYFPVVVFFFIHIAYRSGTSHRT